MADVELCLDERALKEIVLDALAGVEVLSLKAEPAVAAGEHYLSTLLRVHVTFRGVNANAMEETSLIIKTQPQGVLSGFVRECDMFVKELAVYNKLVTRVNEICGKNVTPNRLGSIRSDILVLEDLKLKGFQMKDRVGRLDFEHAKEALKLLADFHAASIVLHAENPLLFEEVKTEKMYKDDNMFMRSFITNTFTTAGEEFEKIAHLKKYGDRLRNVGEKTWSAVQEAVIPHKDRINVLNHGDFWTTNILYCYDNQHNIKDIRFVDFQFTRWGSPAFDLQMLFTTSLADRRRIPELKSVYLQHLNKHLPQKLSEKSLEEELRRLDCFGFLTSVCTMPICTLDPKTPLNFSDTTTEDYDKDFPKDRPNPYLTALQDEKFLKIIPEYLEYYENQNLL